uniref:Putative secreted protein n=1 Tax=Ixodes ricinus TaxID=34613 RepID=A0A6B0UP67_IXORI
MLGLLFFFFFLNANPHAIHLADPAITGTIVPFTLPTCPSLFGLQGSCTSVSFWSSNYGSLSFLGSRVFPGGYVGCSARKPARLPATVIGRPHTVIGQCQGQARCWLIAAGSDHADYLTECPT